MPCARRTLGDRLIPAGSAVVIVGEVRRTFLVECYCPDPASAGSTEAIDRVLAAARALRLDGHDIAYLDGMLLASDDVVFHRFASTRVDDVTAVCRAAGIPVTRITEYTEVGARTSPAWSGFGSSGVGAPSALRPGEIEP